MRPTVAALRFLAASRRDPELRAALARVWPEAGLAAIVSIAHEAGFAVTTEGLRHAFAHDWGLRRARYLTPTDRGRAPAPPWPS